MPGSAASSGSVSAGIRASTPLMMWYWSRMLPPTSSTAATGDNNPDAVTMTSSVTLADAAGVPASVGPANPVSTAAPAATSRAVLRQASRVRRPTPGPDEQVRHIRQPPPLWVPLTCPPTVRLRPSFSGKFPNTTPVLQLAPSIDLLKPVRPGETVLLVRSVVSFVRSAVTCVRPNGLPSPADGLSRPGRRPPATPPASLAARPAASCDPRRRLSRPGRRPPAGRRVQRDHPPAGSAAGYAPAATRSFAVFPAARPGSAQ